MRYLFLATATSEKYSSGVYALVKTQRSWMVDIKGNYETVLSNLVSWCYYELNKGSIITFYGVLDYDTEQYLEGSLNISYSDADDSMIENIGPIYRLWCNDGGGSIEGDIYKDTDLKELVKTWVDLYIDLTEGV